MSNGFAEGTLELGTGIWFCVEHGTSNVAGKECAWCVSDNLSPAEFDRWLDSQ